LRFLFAPLEFTTDAWEPFSARPEIFLAKGHLKPFLGFADDQLKRLLGQKGQKNVHRAELEHKHGYDTKYAMHVIRLYGEAKELMESGRIYAAKTKPVRVDRNPQGQVFTFRDSRTRCAT
jgi:sensor histidine kinase regulating citrate/malate metabolism